VIRSLFLSWAVMALAFAVTAWLVPGLSVSGGVGAYLWVSLLFGLVNAILGTLLRIVSAPIMLLTLGLFAIVVNAVVLELTAAVSSHLNVDDFFWTAVVAAIVLSIAAVVISAVLRAVGGRRARA
jgi:putative membrane protein